MRVEELRDLADSSERIDTLELNGVGMSTERVQRDHECTLDRQRNPFDDPNQPIAYNERHNYAPIEDIFREPVIRCLMNGGPYPLDALWEEDFPDRKNDLTSPNRFEITQTSSGFGIYDDCFPEVCNDRYVPIEKMLDQHFNLAHWYADAQRKYAFEHFPKVGNMLCNTSYWLLCEPIGPIVTDFVEFWLETHQAQFWDATDLFPFRRNYPHPNRFHAMLTYGSNREVIVHDDMTSTEVSIPVTHLLDPRFDLSGCYRVHLENSYVLWRHNNESSILDHTRNCLNVNTYDSRHEDSVSWDPTLPRYLAERLPFDHPESFEIEVTDLYLDASFIMSDDEWKDPARIHSQLESFLASHTRAQIALLGDEPHVEDWSGRLSDLNDRRHRHNTEIGDFVTDFEHLELNAMLPARDTFVSLERNSARKKDLARNVPKPLVVEVNINGHKARALIDTGSLSDFMSSNLADQLHVDRVILEKPLPIQLAVQGSKTKCNAGTKVNFQYQGIHCERWMDIINIQNYDLVLGTPFLHQFQVQVGLNPPTINIGSNEPLPLTGPLVARLESRAMQIYHETVESARN
jgi:hypothetical protein